MIAVKSPVSESLPAALQYFVRCGKNDTRLPRRIRMEEHLPRITPDGLGERRL